jgi:hypothetical protein
VRSPPPSCGVSEFLWHDSSTYSVLSVNNCLLPRLGWAGSQLRGGRSILRNFRSDTGTRLPCLGPSLNHVRCEASGSSSAYRLRFRELCRCSDDSMQRQAELHDENAPAACGLSQVFRRNFRVTRLWSLDLPLHRSTLTRPAQLIEYVAIRDSRRRAQL